MRWILFLLILFWSCNKDNVHIVDPAFVAYLDLFQQEALNRGVDVRGELEMLNISFTSFDQNIAGQCQASKDAHTILMDSNYWNKATDIEREVLLFHELGHCILGRSHLDDKTARSQCVSIMRSSSGICKMEYNANTRGDYLDELFMGK
ncbi:MAG: hypothetical protein IPG87_20345 [Saprospiraceae bacterium]|nr:hypothetical protein [Candidatus Vicinibacter affinis]